MTVPILHTTTVTIPRVHKDSIYNVYNAVCSQLLCVYSVESSCGRITLKTNMSSQKKKYLSLTSLFVILFATVPSGKNMFHVLFVLKLYKSHVKMSGQPQYPVSNGEVKIFVL